MFIEAQQVAEIDSWWILPLLLVGACNAAAGARFLREDFSRENPSGERIRARLLTVTNLGKFVTVTLALYAVFVGGWR